jgi:hypothetical protein
MNVVIYANCQGLALNHVILGLMPTLEAGRLSVILNFEHLNSGIPLPVDVLKKANVFVFQPVQVRHGVFSTDSVLRTLPSDCTRISFPYIFNSGFWPLVPHGGRILGANEFVKKLPFAASLRRAESEIDSRVAVDLALGRYVSDLQRLKDTESTTTVKISNFIEEHVSSRRLFWTENHPVEEVMVEVPSGHSQHGSGTVGPLRPRCEL